MLVSSTTLLPITVDSRATITISAQIAQQIKLLIVMGKLPAGKALPTVTQLAKQLAVNHNTIAAVYNDLITSGLLVAQRGKGTFVASAEVIQDILPHKYFYNLLNQAFTAAAQVGITPSEFSAAAYAQAVALNQCSTSAKLVFIEGSPEDGAICESVSSEIQAPLLLLRLQDLREEKSEVLDKLLTADLIVTTAPYLWEILDMASVEQEVMGVDIEPELSILTEISSLSRGKKVLLLCREQAEAERIKQVLIQSGISHLNFFSASVEQIRKKDHLLDQADRIYATKSVEHYIRQYAAVAERVKTLHLVVQQNHLSVLKTRLAAIQSMKLMS
jgi:DNA-binding transcriptional regulator YhcF (GntR family)